MNDGSWLVTCEHGGNQVPAEHQSLLGSTGAASDLKSHRGYDPGALDAAIQFSEHLGARRIVSETTRLLIDLNRSLDNPTLFSKWTSPSSDEAKAQLVDQYYRPYRERVAGELRRGIESAGQVVHLSIHTFTPRYRGQWRPIDIGLLFDPSRSTEKTFCEQWRFSMNRQFPRMRVVANQPYAGTDDGLTTYLRRHYSASEYLGIEVEISHRYWKRSVDSQRKTVKALLETIPPTETHVH